MKNNNKVTMTKEEFTKFAQDFAKDKVDVSTRSLWIGFIESMQAHGIEEKTIEQIAIMASTLGVEIAKSMLEEKKGVM